MFSFLYQYKRITMGTSRASSKIQKHIREVIKDCKNTIHIKDNILYQGVGQGYDQYLDDVFCTLQVKGINYSLT